MQRKPNREERTIFLLYILIPTLLSIVYTVWAMISVSSPIAFTILGLIPYFAIISLVIFGVAHPSFPNSWALFLWGLDIVLIILMFAAVNSAFGLSYGCDFVGSCTSYDFANGVYFSIVTFTTLGFGDFQPHESLRLYAAFQALIGYLSLGIGITFGMKVLDSKYDKSGGDDVNEWSFRVWFRCYKRLYRLWKYQENATKSAEN